MGTERWLRWLPFGLLGLASLVAVVASPEMGDDVAADVPLALGVAGADRGLDAGDAEPRRR